MRHACHVLHECLESHAACVQTPSAQRRAPSAAGRPLHPPLLMHWAANASSLLMHSAASASSRPPHFKLSLPGRRLRPVGTQSRARALTHTHPGGRLHPLPQHLRGAQEPLGPLRLLRLRQALPAGIRVSLSSCSLVQHASIFATRAGCTISYLSLADYFPLPFPPSRPSPFLVRRPCLTSTGYPRRRAQLCSDGTCERACAPG